MHSRQRKSDRDHVLTANACERLRRVTLGSEVTQSRSCVISSHLQSHPVGDPYARPAVGEAEVQLTCPKS